MSCRRSLPPSTLGTWNQVPNQVCPKVTGFFSLFARASTLYLGCSFHSWLLDTHFTSISCLFEGFFLFSSSRLQVPEKKKRHRSQVALSKKTTTSATTTTTPSSDRERYRMEWSQIWVLNMDLEWWHTARILRRPPTSTAGETQTPVGCVSHTFLHIPTVMLLKHAGGNDIGKECALGMIFFATTQYRNTVSNCRQQWFVKWTNKPPPSLQDFGIMLRYPYCPPPERKETKHARARTYRHASYRVTSSNVKSTTFCNRYCCRRLLSGRAHLPRSVGTLEPVWFFFWSYVTQTPRKLAPIWHFWGKMYKFFRHVLHHGRSWEPNCIT